MLLDNNFWPDSRFSVFFFPLPQILHINDNGNNHDGVMTWTGNLSLIGSAVILLTFKEDRIDARERERERMCVLTFQIA
jgi:hypothetical protein